MSILKQAGSDHIKKLIGEPIIDIGRASDMVWFSLGKAMKARNYKGDEIESSTFAIHLQCPWRMIQGNRNNILIASYDIYEPNSLAEWKEEFDWDIQGNNLFDEKVRKWKEDNSSVFVKDVEYNMLGDLKLILSNDDILEIFIHTSSNSECWRFFECNTNKEHLVVSGKGEEYQ